MVINLSIILEEYSYTKKINLTSICSYSVNLDECFFENATFERPIIN